MEFPTRGKTKFSIKDQLLEIMLDLHFKLLLEMQIQHGEIISKNDQYGKFVFSSFYNRRNLVSNRQKTHRVL